MDYSVRHISGNRYQINLLPSNSEERTMIQNMQPENLEMYYHDAVAKKLGSSAYLLSVDNIMDRYSVIGTVENARGFGGI